MQDSGSLAVFKVTARDQGHYKGPSGAFVTYCPFLVFSFSSDFSSKISSQPFKKEASNGIHVYNDRLYCGNENGPSPICSSLYLFFFLSL